jgi:hypothetical protein
MSAATLNLIVMIVGLVVQYGVPAITNAINALGKDEITVEDIEALKSLIKPPEEY